MSKKMLKLNAGMKRAYRTGGKGSALSSLFSVALIASLTSVMPAHASLEPAYYPSGPQQNVSKQTLIDGGWELCWSGLYDASDSMQNIFDSCTGTYIIYAAGETDADTYLLAAAGERTSVFTETALNETVENNGSFWYLNYRSNGGGGSMGFAPDSTITQTSADTSNLSDPLRLSWHTEDGDGSCGALTICGGWRVGTIQWLNGSSQYERAIWQASERPEPVVETLEPEPVQFGGPLASGATFARNESGQISEVRVAGKRMHMISSATIDGVEILFEATRNSAVFSIPSNLAKGTYDLVLQTSNGQLTITRLITIR